MTITIDIIDAYNRLRVYNIYATVSVSNGNVISTFGHAIITLTDRSRHPK